MYDNRFMYDNRLIRTNKVGNLSSRALWDKNHLIVPTEVREHIKQLIGYQLDPNHIIITSNIDYTLDIFVSDSTEVPPFVSCIADFEPKNILITEVVESVLLELYCERCRVGNIFHKYFLRERQIAHTNELIHSVNLNVLDYNTSSNSLNQSIEVSGSIEITYVSTTYESTYKPRTTRMSLFKSSVDY